MPLSANSALQKEVLRLAALDPEDLEQVLDALQPAHAERVRKLLRAALSLPEPTQAPMLPAWIEERVEGQISEMTVRARSELTACVRALAPAATGSHTPLPSRSLFEQTLSLFSKGRP